MKNLGPLSGFRDMLSAQTLARQKVLDSVTLVYEMYGFMPIKTPAIERFETLNGKYGDEAATLIYEFKDRGSRHLALRYDHTVPLARIMAAQSQSLPRPYKRYVVGDVWRGESPQTGRYREFTQIDADIVGSDSYLADIEILLMMHDVFKALNVSVTIEINDRRILDGLAEGCGINDRDLFLKFIGVIDKVAKIGVEQVLKEIETTFGSSTKEHVQQFLSDEYPSLDEILKIVDNQKTVAGIDNLRKILTVIEALGIADIKFRPSIARGLNYYTSTIFETIINELPSLGSVCSGGRYDNLIQQLGGPDSPAVGTSMGLDRLMEGLSMLGLHQVMHTKTKVYIANLDENLDAERLSMAQKLRQAGMPTEIYYAAVKLGKQLEVIHKLGVNKVIIYGQQEKQKDLVIVRDLESSTQEEVHLNDLVNYFQDENK